MARTKKKSAKKRPGTTRKKTSARSPVRKKAAKKAPKKKVARKTLGKRKKPARTRTWKEGDRTGFILRGLRFPLALDRRINRAVKRLGTDRTALVKEVMGKYLDRLEGKSKRGAKRTRRST